MTDPTGPWCWLNWIESTPEEKARWQKEDRRRRRLEFVGCVLILVAIVSGLVGIGIAIGRYL